MKKLLVALLIGASPIPASAGIVYYTLQDVTFSDGGTASGAFEWNDDADSRFQNINITTSGGGLGTANYTVMGGYNNVAFQAYSPGYANYLQLWFEGLTMAVPGTYSLLTESVYSQENQGGTGFRWITGGSATGVSTDVPEPAMLGLFGFGAVALGLSRRRRKA